MSSLTKETQICYTPMYYNHKRESIEEGPDFNSEDEAIERAEEDIAFRIEQTGQYMYAVIEKRVVPIYK